MNEKNNSEQNIIQAGILYEYGGWVDSVYTIQQLQQNPLHIPSSWLKIIDISPSMAINQLWDNKKKNLPRFVQYLKESVLSLTIAEGPTGSILIYHIKDWEETEEKIGQYEDGFMLAGLPTSTEKIHIFEKTWGEIPAALKSLWEIHGFVILKSGSVLASINDSEKELCSSPIFLGTRSHPTDPQEKYECLAIADAWKDLPVCLTRKPGMSKWNDLLVLGDRDEGKVFPTVRTNIDDLLTDWTFSKWEPS